MKYIKTFTPVDYCKLFDKIRMLRRSNYSICHDPKHKTHKRLVALSSTGKVRRVLLTIKTSQDMVHAMAMLRELNRLLDISHGLANLPPYDKKLIEAALLSHGFKGPGR